MSYLLDRTIKGVPLVPMYYKGRYFISNRSLYYIMHYNII